MFPSKFEFGVQRKLERSLRVLDHLGGCFKDLEAIVECDHQLIPHIAYLEQAVSGLAVALDCGVVSCIYEELG
jgi:hypothetical protein